MFSKEEIARKQRLVDLMHSIHSKYKNFKENENKFKKLQGKKYEPILQQLSLLSSSAKANEKKKKNKEVPDIEEEEDEVHEVDEGDTTDEYEQPNLITNDPHYGLSRNANGEYRIVDIPVKFTGEHMYLGSIQYDDTPGLCELLPKIIPRQYMAKDLQQYKSILRTTKHHF